MPVRAEAAAVAAANLDGDAEWPADHEWVQTPNPYGRTISGDPEAHTVRTAKVRFKTSGAAKAEAVEVAKAEVWLCKVETAEVSKAEARLCKVEAAEVSRAEARQCKVEAVEASRAEAWQCRVEAAEASQAEAWQCKAGVAEAARAEA